MTDYSKYPNPYDFANPVSKKKLFVGRSEELKDIEYYLDQTKKSEHPINIALLGPRASGKTSLLNMCDLEANKRDLLTVRIDLDEGDSKNQLSLFYKIFDSTISKVCEMGAFEGIDGKTYQSYLDIINTHTIPEDKTFCPFLFPLQYAKAFSSHNFDAQLSDNSFKRDLIIIQEEINQSIVLLFDEGDVLANNKTNLQKLRNIFTNISGYMLIFAGTPNLFPVMDEVFSPIVRQFKKIQIGGFNKIEDTEECIKQPLENLGIKVEEIINEFSSVYNEIHKLSIGRPYEIQLICHFLFRSLQEKRTNSFSLNFNVMENVRRELETSQDISSRPIISKIQSLTDNQLNALNILTTCDGRATFPQIWGLEYIHSENTVWTKETLDDNFQYFIQQEIINAKDDFISFAGDEFDKIYSKYFAQEKQLGLFFQDNSPRIYSFFKVKSRVGELHGVTPIGPVFHKNTDLEKGINDWLSDKDISDSPLSNEYIILELYEIMEGNSNFGKIDFFALEFDVLGIQWKTYVYIDDPNAKEGISAFNDYIKNLRRKCLEMKGSLNINEFSINVPTDEILVKKVLNTKNDMLSGLCHSFHAMRAFDEYIENKDNEKALYHLYKSLIFKGSPHEALYNNYGYIFMSNRNFPEAREMLTKSLNYIESIEVNEIEEFSEDICLINYNYGVLELFEGNIENSKEYFKVAFEVIQQNKIEKIETQCLFIPDIFDGEIIIKEVWKPDLIEAVKKSLKVSDQISN